MLDVIAARPATRAPDLAASFGRETAPFKIDVRKLKNLGLTLSLPVGYRLSRAARRTAIASERHGERKAVVDRPGNSMVRPSLERPIEGEQLDGASLSRRRRLTSRPEAVAAEAAVGRDDAVARHDEEHRVPAARRADRPRATRRADRFGHFGVAARLAERDALELLPHTPLERGALHVEREPARGNVAVDAAQHLGDDVGEQRVVARDVGRGELVAQDRFEHRGIGPVQDAADPSLGRGDEDGPEAASRTW